MNLSLELGERLASVDCDCCGGKHRSAYGFIYNGADAFGLYFATLHTGHAEPSVGLTLSIGKWGEDALSERCWVFLQVWTTEKTFNMAVTEPKLSQHFSDMSLGSPLDREAALASPLRDQIFSVADFIVEHDAAVNSYLQTGMVDESGWEQQRRTQAQHSARN